MKPRFIHLCGEKNKLLIIRYFVYFTSYKYIVEINFTITIDSAGWIKAQRHTYKDIQIKKGKKIEHLSSIKNVLEYLRELNIFKSCFKYLMKKILLANKFIKE